MKEHPRKDARLKLFKLSLNRKLSESRFAPEEAEESLIFLFSVENDLYFHNHLLPLLEDSDHSITKRRKDKFRVELKSISTNYESANLPHLNKSVFPLFWKHHFTLQSTLSSDWNQYFGLNEKNSSDLECHPNTYRLDRRPNPSQTTLGMTIQGIFSTQEKLLIVFADLETNKTQFSFKMTPNFFQFQFNKGKKKIFDKKKILILSFYLLFFYNYSLISLPLFILLFRIQFQDSK